MRPMFFYQKVPGCEIPYMPTSDEYVILDNGKNPLVSKMIMDNIDVIEDLLSKKGRCMFYLPRFLQLLRKKKFEDLPTVTRYNCPQAEDNQIKAFNLPTLDVLYAMFGYSQDDCPYDCMLVEAYCRTKDWKTLTFRICPIFATNYNEFEDWLENVCIDDRPQVRFHRADDSPHETADDNFDWEIRRLGEEIFDRVKQLKAKGLTEYAIKRLVNSFDTPKSRLVVDEEFRIFLPEFNNLEIKLTPAVKTVYFLFLLYPEGIYFKDLTLHKEELEKIYALLNRFENKDKVKEVVGHLTDPLDNSINEKCARIKNAFVSAFRDDIAEDYYIDGARGCKKCVGDIEIVLPDELLRIKQKLR